MKVVEIDSYSSLLKKLNKNTSAYLLLYKSGAEASECALQNAIKTKVNDVEFWVADVSKVRDIHGEFGVKTAPILLKFNKGQLVNTFKGCNDVSFYDQIFKQDYFSTSNDNREKKAKRVTVYSTPSCTWCTTLKKHLDQHGIRYKNVDISRDQKAAEAMVKKSGQQGVPQTDINGRMIVGFDKAKINNLLEI